ncbi:hypothetical protein DFH09DRAFT_1087254 [Mycena vulgaris]|nr:hypothetical protein DFH09DRAFT_1087254 [Mycena vulgaris]
MGKRCTGCYLTDQEVSIPLSSCIILTFEDGTDIIAWLGGSGTGQDDTIPADELEQRFLSEVANLRYVKKYPVLMQRESLLARIHAELDLLTNRLADWTEQRKHMDRLQCSDPTEVVGIIDWEGSGSSPVWDVYIVNDPDELAELKALQKDIFQDAQLYTGYSKLHLARLLYITDYRHSVESKRSDLDGLFIEWFDGVCANGSGAHLESFFPLKKFIEQSRIRIVNGMDPRHRPTLRYLISNRTGRYHAPASMDMGSRCEQRYGSYFILFLSALLIPQDFLAQTSLQNQVWSLGFTSAGASLQAHRDHVHFSASRVRPSLSDWTEESRTSARAMGIGMRRGKTPGWVVVEELIITGAGSESGWG